MFCKEPQKAQLEDSREKGQEVDLEKWLKPHLEEREARTPPWARGTH